MVDRAAVGQGGDGRLAPDGAVVAWGMTDGGGSVVLVHDAADGSVTAEHDVPEPLAVLPTARTIVVERRGDR